MRHSVSFPENISYKAEFTFWGSVSSLKHYPESNVQTEFVFTPLCTTRFPTASISAIHIRADWPLDWSSAAKWALLLITYLNAAVRAAK